MLLTLLIWSLTALAAPKLTYDDLATGRPEYLPKGELSSYTASNGLLLKAGTRLIVGAPNGSAATGIAVKTGSHTAVGTSVGTDYFQTITNGSSGSTAARAFLAGLAQQPNPALWMAPAALRGTELEVQSVELAGSKRNARVFVTCRVVNRSDAVNRSGIARIVDVELALRLGEVSDAVAAATAEAEAERQEALAKLKEAKDLVDLELMSQDDYNALKAELAPIILREARPEGTEPPSPQAPAPEPTDAVRPPPSASGGPNVIDASVRFKGEDGQHEVRQVKALLDHDNFDMAQCFEQEGDAMDIDLRFRADGTMAKVSLTGAPTPCLLPILEAWTIEPMPWPAPMKLKLEAKRVEGVEPPPHSRWLQPTPQPSPPPAPPDPQALSHSVVFDVRSRDGKSADGIYAIRKAAKNNGSTMAACFERAGEEVEVSFTLRMDGTIGKVWASGGDQQCLSDELGGWQTDDIGWPAKLEMTITSVANDE